MRSALTFAPCGGCWWGFQNFDEIRINHNVVTLKIENLCLEVLRLVFDVFSHALSRWRRIDNVIAHNLNSWILYSSFVSLVTSLVISNYTYLCKPLSFLSCWMICLFLHFIFFEAVLWKYNHLKLVRTHVRTSTDKYIYLHINLILIAFWLIGLNRIFIFLKKKRYYYSKNV